MLSLPIDAVLPEVLDALRASASVVLQAPPGAGKTTRVPPAILDAGLASAGQIVMLEPRRIAARAAARRISFERGTTPGDLIGWQVRFERQATARTKILCVTPGILLRMLQDDPYLERVSCVIFDEFHERGLETDLALGLARLIQQNVRPELKIVVMSATLSAGPVAKYLGDCPVVTSEGRAYPVEIRHEPKRDDDRLSDAVCRVIDDRWDRTTGDILVFLPGVGEIMGAKSELEARLPDAAVLPLYGDLSAEEQDRVLQPAGHRKIVLATNVAETSVTVEGISTVIDTGVARQLTYDPAVGLDRLELLPISQASADQRAGRAGRTQAGVCVRLWSEIAQRSRLPQTPPEIQRVDLAASTLQLLSLGENPFAFGWLDPPADHVVEQSVEVLQKLGAVADGRITPLGRRLAKLPVHPRLGRMLLEGAALGHPDRVALAAAFLSDRDPFGRISSPHETSSDVLDRLEWLEAFEGNRGGRHWPASLNPQGAKPVLRSRDQLARLLQQEQPTERCDADTAVRRAILAGFPDRVCRRRETTSDRGVMVGGRGVRLTGSSGVKRAEFFVAIDVDAGGSETLVRQASAIEREWLVPVTESVEVTYDDSTDKVSGWKVTRWLDLVLDQRPAGNIDKNQRADALVTAAMRDMERALPRPESDGGMYLLRVRCLRNWMPELNLPDLSGDVLHELLTWLAPGCKSLAELREADWANAFREKLTHHQRNAVEREAPERMEVPTGSEIKLTYEEGRPPVLAVRLQELFGLTDTPRIAGNRVKVLLHLLAPNYRPEQVTDDLASFWANTYPTVRKELRSRYPKHSWPDDPLTATAIRGPKKRRP
ncbi:ATP-dependent helicase HrpB [Zavarzinella formosa]|uniref:ATP-dependent helicase HrpB n=1 Tax=Zavarzinella formosa TaxID=360055 RepID=UPI0002E15290|nr:ATP-dependent helicase HrpB [Zavarzinella formosa]